MISDVSPHPFPSLQGYAERKVILLCDVIQICKKLHNDELRKERLAALKSRTVAMAT